MWQRFTERSRRVVFFAQEEAGRLGENYVSTEHLLLGLCRENDSVAARVLDQMGVSLSRIRSEIERQITRGDGRLGQDMQLTPRAKRVIDLAYDEARTLNNNYIGTEHILLGLVREGEGLAGRVLSNLGVDIKRTRTEVAKIQDKGGSLGHDSDTIAKPDLPPSPSRLDLGPLDNVIEVLARRPDIRKAIREDLAMLKGLIEIELVVISGTAELKPENREAALALIEEIVKLSREEEGCISYTFYADLAEPNTIQVFEEWETEAALNAHLAQPHTQNFLASIGPLLAGPPNIVRYFVARTAPL